MNTIENAKEIISSYKRDDGKKLRIMDANYNTRPNQNQVLFSD